MKPDSHETENLFATFASRSRCFRRGDVFLTGMVLAVLFAFSTPSFADQASEIPVAIDDVVAGDEGWIIAIDDVAADAGGWITAIDDAAVEAGGGIAAYAAEAGGGFAAFGDVATEVGGGIAAFGKVEEEIDTLVVEEEAE